MDQSAAPRTLGAVIYPNFEPLDLYGPLEMFGMVEPRLRLVMVAAAPGPVASTPGPQTVAEFGFADCPPLDLLLVPGGIGTRSEVANQTLLSFLAARVPATRLTLSVCTGSWLLARAGCLDGRRATSNKAVFRLAEVQSAAVTWVPQARWVQDGPFYTASGVSAGLDMSLAVIAALYGEAEAARIAQRTEYVWQRDPDQDPFYPYLNSLVPPDPAGVAR
ncbi:MAG: DJ-1/PfpI family protein [Deltaproteobacteria bacterium]|nr:DJ-1/PfpI family protein [Deltaproteobacteria bacterium]